MNRELLEYAIDTYGTPLYVFDLTILADTVKLFRQSLDGSAGLCFAMKANPFLAGKMSAMTDRIEVCSAGEFEICRRAHIPPEKRIISGVLKEKEALFKIMDDCQAACIYTAESENQLRLLSEWAAAHQTVVPVYLRLTSGNQFGMDLPAIEEILCKNAFPFVKICGIHYFSGTQKKSIQKITNELNELDQILLELEAKTGCRIPFFEYGPGLSVAYFEGQTDTLTEDLCLIRDAIQNMKYQGSVTLEMGRALAAKCGYYLTRVMDTKKNNGRNYAITDGGMHQLHYDGQIRGMYRPEHFLYSQPIPQKEEWTVCGCLCTANDVLMQSALFSGLKEGDVLVFQNTGAYSMTEGMALFLSHPLPRIVTYDKENGWEQLREKQETFYQNQGGTKEWKHS